MWDSKRFSPFFKQSFVTATVCINIIGHGCVVGFPAILLPQLREPGSVITPTKNQESWIVVTSFYTSKTTASDLIAKQLFHYGKVKKRPLADKPYPLNKSYQLEGAARASIHTISMVVGYFLTPPIMERLGRKTTHYITALPFLVGWLYTVMATSVQDLLIGRTLQGVSSGLLTILRAVLIGEYTSPRNRGAFLTTISLAQAFGIFFVHLIGSLLSWQLTALICAFFAYVSFVMTMFTPESPSWLVAQGKYDECRTVFEWLRGDSENDELEEMIDAHVALEKANEQRSAKVGRFESIWETAKKKEFYKPIILMLHANVLMQFSGGTTMAAYSTIIIGLLMGPAANAHFWMVFLDTQRIISNSMAVYVINRVKRRTIMFSTGALCVAAHLAISAYVYSRETGALTYTALWLPALLINIQFFTVAVGMVPMPNVIAGEVFPLEYRGICGTISLTTSNAFMFLALKTFPQLVDTSGLQGTYLLYSVMLTYILAVMWVMLPETMGKTLHQIEEEFRGRPLLPEEAEVKRTLQMDPVEAYRSKLSLRRMSVVL